jgi:cytochrome bd ubiquinol oxidase subunit II
MDLASGWFAAIAVLWTGWFVLEGFDLGVGMLLARQPAADRRVALGAIGPVWDGNEVWLITALGAMFAAFPAWYAGLLSGFYLPALLIVLGLVVRGVALEYRRKVTRPAWCDRGIVAGSLLPAFGWGYVFAQLVRGVDVAPGPVVGAPEPLHPYALLGGLATTALFLLHGATFLALKTDGPARVAARRAAGRLVAPTAVVAGGFAVWTLGVAAGRAADTAVGPGTAAADGAPAGTVPLGAAFAATAVVAALLLAAVMLARGREGRAFAATTVAVAALVATLFATLYPYVLPDAADPHRGLTVAAAAAGPYTLGVLSAIAAAFLPVVLAYQAWTYWVFRRRVTR